MRFLFLILLGIILPSNAEAWRNYQQVTDASQFTQFREFKIENMNASYRGVSSQERAMVIYHADQAYRLLDQFYNNPDTCRERSLNIYHVEESVINNREIMHFVNWDHLGSSSLYGFYDARASPRGTASIFLRRSADTQSTIDTIVHEVAHHYQYTHCINQSEAEAYRFESFYRDNRV